MANKRLAKETYLQGLKHGFALCKAQYDELIRRDYMPITIEIESQCPKCRRNTIFHRVESDIYHCEQCGYVKPFNLVKVIDRKDKE